MKTVSADVIKYKVQLNFILSREIPVFKFNSEIKKFTRMTRVI